MCNLIAIVTIKEDIYLKKQSLLSYRNQKKT